MGGGDVVRLRAEFTVFPFVEGSLPPYVQAAIDAARATGVRVNVGPLSSTVEGEPDAVVDALRAAQSAAFAGGARRFVLNLEVAG
jgi:uncharacterized protein YqgV (UPF0045/DUF77 family)